MADLGGVRVWIGGLLLLIYAALAVMGERIAPLEANATSLLDILSAPSAEFWLGTDNIGRDQFSRIIIGARYTVSIAVTSVVLAILFGTALGLAAGYFGGRIDAALRAVIDVLLTVPEMVLAIAIAAALGAGATGTIAAIVVSFTPRVARLVRARTMEVRAEAFVDAALALGFRHRRIALRHVLPNVATVIIIEASLLAGQAVLVAAALGFLGLGVPPPAPEWGAMLGAGRDYIDVAPHLVVGPGIAISILIFSFNMLGDGLRDRLDPRARI